MTVNTHKYWCLQYVQKKSLSPLFQWLMSSYLYQRLSSVSSFLMKLSAPVECVSTAGGAQGCKGSIHYTSRASLYGALMTRALLRIKSSDLRQMVFNMLRGKAPFTSSHLTPLQCRKADVAHWQLVLYNKCQRLKVYDVVRSVYTLIHFPIFAFMACSGDWECCWILRGLHEGAFLKLLFYRHLSIQSHIS